MPKILSASFFNRPTLKIAQELLGKFLVRKIPHSKFERGSKIGKKEIAGMITEVEIYVGPKDKASHASRGKTERNKIMFGKAGYWYVYLTYGLHWMLNIVTEKEGYPAAILIRSVRLNVNKSLRSLESVNNPKSIIRGPGRVCRHFKIDKRLNAKPANCKTGLWIEDRKIKITPRLIRRGKRIGIDYAGRWKDKLWRFYV